MTRRLLKNVLNVNVLCFLLCVPQAHAAFGDRITISGSEFRVGTNRIWINGANTPWHSWDDFGAHFERKWWDDHFRQLHENGINATRVWISCDGAKGINIDPSGHVSGCTEAFWNDLDALFDIARKHQVYINATLLSFDHFTDNHPAYKSWRNMIADTGNVDSMVTNYVAPFVARYKDNPWLWCVDLCNEPDWVHENPKRGGLSWDLIQTCFAKMAVAVHAQSKVLVTVGISMGPKYNAREGYTNSLATPTNIFSDSALQAKAGGDVRARLDFYSPHHYSWMNETWGIPFNLSPADYGMDPTRPVIIGESPAKGLTGGSAEADYEGAFEKGWQGVMGWSSDGVDSNGSMPELGLATRAFRDKHPELVFPGATRK